MSSFKDFIENEIKEIARSLNVAFPDCDKLSNDMVIKWVEMHAEEFRRNWEREQKES